jgi:hypothetical protein
VRLARLSDEREIAVLMESSIRHFSPAHNNAVQFEACVRYVSVRTPDLMEDGTYYVAEGERGLIERVGCPVRRSARSPATCASTAPWS